MNLWVSADLGCVWLILAGFTYMCMWQRSEIGQRQSAGFSYVSHGLTGAIQVWFMIAFIVKEGSLCMFSW